MHERNKQQNEKKLAGMIIFSIDQFEITAFKEIELRNWILQEIETGIIGLK